MREPLLQGLRVQPGAGAYACEMLATLKEERLGFAMTLHIVRLPVFDGLDENGHPQFGFGMSRSAKELVVVFACIYRTAPEISCNFRRSRYRTLSASPETWPSCGTSDIRAVTFGTARHDARHKTTHKIPLSQRAGSCRVEQPTPAGHCVASKPAHTVSGDTRSASDSVSRRMESMRTKFEQAHVPATKNPVGPSALRRSKRVIVDVPLVIRGEAEDKQPFREETFTLTVSAHGGLVVLENRVALGQKIVLMNPKTWDEREGTVAFLGRLMPASRRWACNSRSPRPNSGRSALLRRTGNFLSSFFTITSIQRSGLGMLQWLRTYFGALTRYANRVSEWAPA